MSPSLESLGIDRMSVADRLSLVHAIWDSIASEHAMVPLSDSQLTEIRRRAAQHDAGEGTTVSWEQVQQEALAQLKQ